MKKGFNQSKIEKIYFSLECKDIKMKDILLNALTLQSITGSYVKFFLSRKSHNKMKQDELDGKLYMVLVNKKEINSFIKVLYEILSVKEKSTFFQSWKSEKLCQLTVTNLDLIVEETTKFKLSYSHKTQLKANIYISFKK